MIQRQITRPMSRKSAGVFMDKIDRDYPKADYYITWNPSHVDDAALNGGNPWDRNVRVVVLNAPKRLPLPVNPLGV